MDPKPPLRVVAADEKPKRTKPMTITEAAAGGDRRDYLVACRARASEALQNPNTAARDLAALLRRATELDAEIRALDEVEEADGGGRSTEDEAWDAEAL